MNRLVKSFQHWLASELEFKALKREHTRVSEPTPQPKNGKTAEKPDDPKKKKPQTAQKEKSGKPSGKPPGGKPPAPKGGGGGGGVPPQANGKGKGGGGNPTVPPKSGGGKGNSKTKGKGDGKGLVVTNATNRQKCAFYQTERNGGKTCNLGDNCAMIHEKCNNDAEYEALFKPWERPKSRGRSKSAGRGNGQRDFSQGRPRPAAASRASQSASGLPDVSHIAPYVVHSWRNVCPNFTNCEKLALGECDMLHYEEPVARACILRDATKVRRDSPCPRDE